MCTDFDTVHFLHPPPHSSVISQKDMQEVYYLPSVDRVPAFGQINNSEKVTLQSTKDFINWHFLNWLNILPQHALCIIKK